MRTLLVFALIAGYSPAMTQDILRLPPKAADHRIAYASDPLQFADLMLPEGNGPHPVVIVIHGGFWRRAYDLQHISHLCDALRQAGFATWSLEYRRIGDEGGAWPGTFQDTGAGADHLRTIAADYNLDLSRVVAIGHSAGGHLALWLGTRKSIPSASPVYAPNPLEVRGIVSLAGVADLRRAFELKLSNTVVADLMGGPPEEFPERYDQGSPAEQLPLGLPQRLIHGALDTNVPLEISADYVEKAKRSGDDAQLIPLPDARHFELIDPRAREFGVVLQTIRDLLPE